MKNTEKAPELEPFFITNIFLHSNGRHMKNFHE
jgi:hypothetical protein